MALAFAQTIRIIPCGDIQQMNAQEATVIFPHQLFKDHPALSRGRDVFLLEDKRFYYDSSDSLRYHKKKLVFLRAACKTYRDELEKKGFTVVHVPYKKEGDDVLTSQLKSRKIRMIHLADPTDVALTERLTRLSKTSGVKVRVMETPMFFLSRRDVTECFKPAVHYSLTRFYIQQRKTTDILVKDDKPAGGKWSFDPANRKRLPAGVSVPPVPKTIENRYTREACDFVEQVFPSNPGDTAGFCYPVTRKKADAWLQDFLQKRLRLFGSYEDAISKNEYFLYHSVLSPLINTGLLTPAEIIDKTLAFAASHPIPINSLEGFVRQILGWREFMRGIYLVEQKRIRSLNFWNHKKKIPKAFYNATTGIEPVDNVLGKVIKNAYAHHIERLMILGNFMFLCEIDPGEVYRWFMEMFIDAYDWVMVPNVYSMSQYSDGGLITTKPYISSSSYVLKMSDFKRGPWTDIWDGLFWRFVRKHKTFFKKNVRLRVMVFQLNRMDKKMVNSKIKKAEVYLNKLG